MAPVTIEDLEARLAAIRTRLEEINAEVREEHGGAMPDELRDEWNTLNEEYDERQKLLGEARVREDRIRQLAASPDHTEPGDGGAPLPEPGNGRRSTPSPARDRDRGDEIYDLSTITHTMGNPQRAARVLRDRAMRSIEQAHFPHEQADRARCQEHIERLLDRFSLDEDNDSMSLFARHLLVTGSPTYRRAFGKSLMGRPLSHDEQRALSLTGSAGGFAVPYQLDPTVIPTSNWSVNPYRAISRIEQIMVDEWRGVTSAGVTASYAAEAAEAADNAPTLAQPTISTERAQCFVPFSYEVGQDWGSLEAEMAVMIQDAKDDLEATAFTTGDGVDEPAGVLTGTTNTVNASSGQTFALANLYALEEALPPRFRPRAQFVANRSIYNRAKQFDTAGGSGVWFREKGLQAGLANQVPTPGNTGARLLDYPANEASAMPATPATGNKFLEFGDFRYYLIVDRIGMSVKLIPDLFGANRRPTGQSGLYAFWRNSAEVLDPNAFRSLLGVA